MTSIFPQIYDLAMRPFEATSFKKVRNELVRSATGKVLEVGSGTGINFPFYEQAQCVVAIEPNPKMNKLAVKRGRNSHVRIILHEASAESLPFDDNTFDTVIATLVFCTIPNPLRALQEIQRVSKPNARILFFEHVQMEQKILAKAQDFLSPFWARICDGCQLNRDTVSLITYSGIEIITIHSLYAKLFLSIKCRNMKKG
ncbi:class I SAM-dependent methyltransferase [Sporosarcina sp. PTS2304]|uniref:class I SAM-dependent methyltransferase n=1 Tax=Sporosarcina sp. PTS2304 TaxID=2283194 RepID=UPI000E0D4F01|nr:class I SAM-dependent methyltransferase [Sporosarcina sp. PTS2304]AXH99532.1 class I SAM-dependent methyltransferase [Sporosarcina sp. PTS2304]